MPSPSFHSTYVELCTDATELFSAVLWLLGGQVSQDDDTPRIPAPVPPSDVHLLKALSIADRNKASDVWTMSYIANWPIYTLGFLVSTAEGKEAVRQDLQRRSELMRLAQVSRFLEDLERHWLASD
jgi:hypothetical protein